jgi:acyl-coenzyme A thioesterase PaaI-like protein
MSLPSPSEALQPPLGFSRHFKRSGFTDPWEPIWSIKTEDAVRIGLHAGNAHCNSRGFVHGALLTALADNAMGLSCIQVRGPSAGGLVTVNLAMDFVATARQGQWIEVQPTVIRVGSSMCFASALVLADGSVCARANATFRVMN